MKQLFNVGENLLNKAIHGHFVRSHRLNVQGILFFFFKLIDFLLPVYNDNIHKRKRKQK